LLENIGKDLEKWMFAHYDVSLWTLVVIDPTMGDGPYNRCARRSLQFDDFISNQANTVEQTLVLVSFVTHVVSLHVENETLLPK
jgi:hypothetical protein